MSLIAGRRWKAQLRLADVFHNDDMTFDQRRDEIVRHIRRAHWFTGSVNYDMHNLVDELADTDSTAYFDQVWEMLYDEFDAERIWVATT